MRQGYEGFPTEGCHVPEYRDLQVSLFPRSDLPATVVFRREVGVTAKGRRCFGTIALKTCWMPASHAR